MVALCSREHCCSLVSIGRDSALLDGRLRIGLGKAAGGVRRFCVEGCEKWPRTSVGGRWSRGWVDTGSPGRVGGVVVGSMVQSV